MVTQTTGAVIVAAGSSARMLGQNKQLAIVQGIPVLARSILAFENLPEISEIVVVTQEALFDEVRSYIINYKIEKVSALIPGGCSRQESVQKGVAALSPMVGYCAIHDGARPFADRELILRCLQAAFKHRAATAAVKVKDTIKLADSNGFISSTPNRNLLYLTQTPQIFEAALFRRASEEALAKHLDFTDDCQLVENVGGRVFLSQGSYNNIKITTPEDLLLAEGIASQLV